jgi:SAM-dependent methyltransferase
MGLEQVSSAATRAERRRFYDEIYKHQNLFHHRRWLYAPYVSSLIAICGLKRGDSILDVGCGQGFFSYLFGTHGMKVHGVDISETGIRAATASYGGLGISFAVWDIEERPLPEKFDCVFVRSCSHYNTEDFPVKAAVSENLLRHLRPGGTFIFAYNSSSRSKRKPTWRCHSLADVQQHFRAYSDPKIFYVNKFLKRLMGKHALSRSATRLSLGATRVCGAGGELHSPLATQ